MISTAESQEPINKKIANPKMKIQTLFTHTHVIPKLYEFRYSVENKINQIYPFISIR